MSSLAPDQWDDFLTSFKTTTIGLVPASAAATTPSTSESVAQSTTSASGEFKPYLFLGASLIEEGGGTKKAFALASCSDRNVICGGQIGSSKFCLKPKAGPGYCDAASHVKVPFEFPPKSLYVKENEIRAWCEPRFDESLLAPEQLHHLLSLKLPKENWIALFESLELGVAPDWLLQSDPKLWTSFAPKTSPTSVLPDDVPRRSAFQTESTSDQVPSALQSNEIEIVSPRFADSAVFINGFPTLSFDDNSQEDDAFYSSLTMDQIGDILQKFTKRFTSLKAKWTSAFSDVEANYLVVVKDLSDLHRFTNTVASSVGQPDPVTTSPSPTLWDQVKLLHDLAVDQFQAMSQTIDDSTASVTTLVQDHSLLQASVAAVEDKVTNTSASFQHRLHQLELTTQSFETRFARLLPVLKQLQVSRPATLTNAPVDASVLNQITELQHQVRKLQDALWTQNLHPTQTPAASTDIEATLRDLKA